MPARVERAGGGGAPCSRRSGSGPRRRSGAASAGGRRVGGWGEGRGGGGVSRRLRWLGCVCACVNGWVGGRMAGSMRVYAAKAHSRGPRRRRGAESGDGEPPQFWGARASVHVNCVCVRESLELGLVEQVDGDGEELVPEARARRAGRWRRRGART